MRAAPGARSRTAAACGLSRPSALTARRGKWTRATSEEQRRLHPARQQAEPHRDVAPRHVRRDAEPIYRERAEKWWRVMKSRMRLRDDGKYFVWNYWDPAGPWDYKPDGSLKHWVGVHPNGGYYAIDVEGIVDALRARPGLHEGGHRAGSSPRTATSCGTSRSSTRNSSGLTASRPTRIGRIRPACSGRALAPYDPTLRKIFVASYDPGSWGGMDAPEWVLRFGPKAKAGQ